MNPESSPYLTYSVLTPVLEDMSSIYGSILSIFIDERCAKAEGKDQDEP
eukprot:CAMPEP_0168331336 /NCGR_PEP_ID=MMETSP0213-20121227/8273_1 /TAXON_ID=151035 /ORGANISM="Euplotes harpa, Strain FSP1.4" /LENGTH=48 /DNA_ID= /DNA_START= /DNA_END= /DNA_ORIENTATION=